MNELWYLYTHFRAWEHTDAILTWRYKIGEEAFKVKGFTGTTLSCASRKKGEGSDKDKSFFSSLAELFFKHSNRAPPSGADPSIILGKKVETEDDILYIKRLPTFGGRLTGAESELLLSYLTVGGYLRKRSLL